MSTCCGNLPRRLCDNVKLGWRMNRVEDILLFPSKHFPSLCSNRLRLCLRLISGKCKSVSHRSIGSVSIGSRL